ncbi:MAG: hypothetical protein JJE04_02555 [Acidobacteriia bacterium]|nr:hypothetical protein [Terriglobia bacterium]
MSVPDPSASQSPEEMHRLLCAAAVQHRPISVLYDGARRLLCPHVLGYNQPGEWRVFCYQFGGESRSGPQPNGGEGIWRCLSLKNLSSVELLDGPWQTEPHARQRCVENIEVEAQDYPGGDPQNGQ